MSDQAEGLRKLFARRAPGFTVIAGCDAAKAAVAMRLAHEAAATGAMTLLVDGTPGRIAQVCGTACRYELADVASGDVQVGDVIRRVATGVYLLPAARALARAGTFTADEEARVADAFARGIPHALAAGGADRAVDRIVVHAPDGRATRAIDAFGRDARAVIVASEDRASLHGAYFEMKALVQAGVSRFELVTRATQSANARLAFTNLAATACRFLEIELADGGSIAWPGTTGCADSVMTPSLIDNYQEEVSDAAIS